MTHFTTYEKTVFNMIANESMNGGVLDINDVLVTFNAKIISSGVYLTSQQLGGVLASLVAKDKVFVDEDGLYWPIHSTNEDASGGFWGDHLTIEEFEADLIK